MPKQRKPYIRSMGKHFKKLFSGGNILQNEVSEIAIWPDGAPGSEGKAGKEKIKLFAGEKVISGIHRPSIIPYIPIPEITKGTAVIIAPGGGHKELWIDHEGHNPAVFFCELGIASFVLKYRLASEANSAYTVQEHALADIQQAIRFVRSHSEEWKINTDRIGVMGFSAGGELAGLAAMHFDHGNKNASNKIAQQSAYPDFQALIYPAGTDRFKASKFSPPCFFFADKKMKKYLRAVRKCTSDIKRGSFPLNCIFMQMKNMALACGKIIMLQ